MSRNRFEDILHALTVTLIEPPLYQDPFWMVRQFLEAFNKNMANCFTPSWINCLHESISIWINMFSCPGFIFVPRNPHPFGNEYHTICCCKSGILWRLELVEGKDRPAERPPPMFHWTGNTVGLLLRLTQPIHGQGKVVILDSGFCVLKGIVELKKRGVYASALIKKRRYWPKYIPGDVIKAHFSTKPVGAADSMAGVLEEVPFHVYCMKEPDYTMMLMSTYGTNSTTNTKRSQREFKDSQGQTRKEVIAYPEVVHNHYLYRHSVDDHNNRRHSPIGLEEVWGTKDWEHRVFAFILAVTEVNVKLAMEHFYHHDKMSQLDFRKQLAKALIYNDYMEADSPKKKRKAATSDTQEHSLQQLPIHTKFLGARIVSATSEYLQKKCTICKKRRCRTYCACSPGEHVCKFCYGAHMVEVCQTS